MSEGLNPATRWNGATALVISEEDVFDPAFGFAYRREYVATREQADGIIASATANGWRASRRVQDDQNRVVIVSPDPTFGANPPTEVPVDSYELSTEYENQEIWSNSKVVAMTHTANVETQIKVLSHYRHFCRTRKNDLYPSYVKFSDELTKNAPNVAVGKGPTPFSRIYEGGGANVANDLNYGDGQGAARQASLAAIYQQVMLGLEFWEVRRVVLSRRRSVSIRYAAKHVVDGVEKIYTTAALKTRFDIPNEVGARLPEDPTTRPPGSVWGWKIRRQDSGQVRGTTRVEEVIDWVFAAWSTIPYDVLYS